MNPTNVFALEVLCKFNEYQQTWNDENAMLKALRDVIATHPEFIDSPSLALASPAQPQVTEENMRKAAIRVTNAYREYRAHGTLPAAGAYQALVNSIIALESALTAPPARQVEVERLIAKNENTQAAIAECLAEVERLREALEPFVKAFEHVAPMNVAHSVGGDKIMETLCVPRGLCLRAQSLARARKEG